MSVSAVNYIEDYTPVAHWTFDDTPNDSTTNSHDLTLYNSPTYDTGKLNNAIDLEASLSHYAQIGDHSDFDCTPTCSMSFWYKPETINNNIYFWVKGTTIPMYRLQTQYATFDRFIFRLWDTIGDDQHRSTVSTGFSVGTWQHIVVIADTTNPSTVAYYIDGTFHASSLYANNATTDMTANTADVYLFSYIGTQGYLDGMVDEFSFFDYELSVAEVGQIYNSGTPLAYSSGGTTPPTTTPTTTATTTTLALDDTNFLLSVIIFFLSIFFLGFILSILRRKK